MPLATERLVLRRPDEGDAGALAAVLEEAERELEASLDHWRAHGFGPWLVEEDGRPVAVLEVHYAGEGIVGIAADEVEVGWVVAEADRGRGIATEAARAAIADAFARTGAERLVAYIRPWNAASIRVAEKLGMVRDGEGRTRSDEPMQIWRIGPKRPL